MPRISNQPRFDDRRIEDVILPAKGESKTAAVLAVRTAMRTVGDKDTRERARELASAKKTIKARIPNFEEPTRVLVADTSVIHVTSSVRDDIKITGGPTYRKTVHLDAKKA